MILLGIVCLSFYSEILHLNVCAVLFESSSGFNPYIHFLDDVSRYVHCQIRMGVKFRDCFKTLLAERPHSEMKDNVFQPFCINSVFLKPSHIDNQCFKRCWMVRCSTVTLMAFNIDWKCNLFPGQRDSVQNPHFIELISFAILTPNKENTLFLDNWSSN